MASGSSTLAGCSKLTLMEYISDVIQTTLSSFDFSYCISVNILTYIAIRIISEHKNKVISTWNKRKILVINIILMSIIYYIIGEHTKLIVNSSILAPVFWSWIIKPICKHFNIDYKKY